MRGKLNIESKLNFRQIMIFSYARIKRSFFIYKIHRLSHVRHSANWFLWSHIQDLISGGKNCKIIFDDFISDVFFSVEALIWPSRAVGNRCVVWQICGDKNAALFFGGWMSWVDREYYGGAMDIRKITSCSTVKFFFGL